MILSHTLDAGCIDPPGKDLPGQNKNAEYVSILLNGLISLLGYSLWNLIDPRTSKEHFGKYFTFFQDAPAGVLRVFVHSGTGKNFVRNEEWHVFVDGEVGSGHWRLNNSGDTVQLRDRLERTVSQKVFPAHSCTPIPAVIPPPIRPAAVAAAAFGEVE